MKKKPTQRVGHPAVTNRKLDDHTIALFKWAGWGMAVALMGLWGHMRGSLPFPGHDMAVLVSSTASKFLWRPTMIAGSLTAIVCAGIGFFRIDTSRRSQQADQLQMYFRPVRWVFLFGVLLEATIWLDYLIVS